MTPEQRADFCRERQKIVSFITTHPSQFYVCEGCESVLNADVQVAFCPKCHGYRFSYDRKRLLDVIAALAEKSPEETLKEYGMMYE
jgi:Zn finger protein HypA/HybF involved in hydrogenase expression